MAQVLTSILAIGPLAPGASTTVAHNLVVDDVPVTPDKVLPNLSTPIVVTATTTTTVTFRNDGSATESATFEAIKLWSGQQPDNLAQMLWQGAAASPGFQPDRTVIVAQTGGDASTIEDGLTQASALVPAPSAANPAWVWVFPGTYTEQPLTVPTGVTVSGQGCLSTIVEAAVTTQPLFTLSANAEVDGMTIQGASGAGGVGILANAAGQVIAKSLYIRDCLTGVRVTGANVVMQVCTTYVLVNGGALDTGIEVAAAGYLDLFSVRVDGSGSGTGVRSTGANSELQCFSVFVSDVTNGMSAEDGGEIDASSGRIEGAAVGFRVVDASEIHAHAICTENITTYGLQITAATGTFEGAANSIRSDQLDIAAGATVLSSQISQFSGDRSMMVLGELAVGLPVFPTESIFGEGDSHVRQMTILRNTNGEAGVWSDITTEMASASGSTADAFPGVGGNNCLYIGGAEKQFPGAKIDTTVAIVLGGGAILWEYWTGAVWQTFRLMTADQASPYNSYAEDTFGRINFEQVRFNANDMAGWAQKALNGITRWWVRCRIDPGGPGTITTSPTLEQIKLHTNRREINSDGRMEQFGTGIEERAIQFHKELMSPFTGAGTPGNANMLYTANITLSSTQNVLADNQLEGLGAVFTLPIGLDTSRPLTVRWNWIPAAAPGNPSQVEFEGFYGRIQEGDVLDGSLTDVAWNEIVVTTGMVIDQVVQSEVELDVSSLIPGDQVVFTLSRDARAGNPDDTLVGNVELSTVELFGLFWR